MKKSILWAIALIFNFQFSIFTSAQAQRHLGGDISLLPSYEEKGTKFYDLDGKKRPALDIFKRAGWDMMRVRLFVDPQNAPQSNKDEGVCQDLSYVLKLSKQIKKAGFKLMLDFHYSDTWADPGKQFTPKRWLRENMGVSERDYVGALIDSVYTYTTNVLKAFNAAGVTPDMIQTGNEITFGTLWPTARVLPSDDAGWTVFSGVLKAAGKACREQCPKAEIIIHTEHAQDWEATQAYYQRIDKFGVPYDVIGLSYYPMWHGTIPHLAMVVDSLAAEFKKPVMLVECAAYYSHENDPWEVGKDHSGDYYQPTPAAHTQFAHDLVAEMLKHPCVTGIFWWFPEENASGSEVTKGWLNRGLFDNKTGRALPALRELQKYVK